MAKYTIAIDAMGGDNAPGAIVKGCAEAARKFDDIELLLFGDRDALTPLTDAEPDVKDRLPIEHAPGVISMHDSPMLAVWHKKDSSMVLAAQAVKDGRAGAMISAGSTGAVLACGMLRIGRIKGIERPAIATVIPGTKGPFLLLDCGANVDCRPSYLSEFALMGSIYMQSMMGVKDPQVRLVNIGEEPEKGNRTAKEAYAIMSSQNLYSFAGNIEAREILAGECDVVVADGFDGNIILKYTEGAVKAFSGMLKESLTSSLRSKLGALLVKPALKGFKERFDYNKYGGAPLLGVDGALIKAHGSSGSEAFASAVRQARSMLESGMTDRIREGMARMPVQQTYTEAEKA